MFAVNLLTPILIAFVTDVFKPDCTPYQLDEELDEFRNGEFCNISTGPTIIYAQGDYFYGRTTYGFTLLVNLRDAIKIANARTGHDLISTGFYGTPLVILMKFVSGLDEITSIRKKFSFTNLEMGADGCARNGFFSFNPNDLVEIMSYPYTFNVTFDKPVGTIAIKSGTEDLNITNLIRRRRGLKCYGGGIGAAYGVGVAVVGVAVMTFCDTEGLEFSLTSKYNKKFDELANTQKLETGKIKDTFKDVKEMLKNTQIENAKFLINLNTHNEQIRVLNQDFEHLQTWFKNENAEIQYKLNFMGSHLQHKLLMTQISVLYNEILDKLTLAVNLWSQNSKNNKCDLYKDLHPGHSIRFEHMLGIKKLKIENIDMQGKLTHMFDFMKTTTELQRNLSRIVSKGLIVSDGMVYTTEHGILTTLEAMKGLINLNQEALNHLVLNSAPWKLMVRGILKIIGGAIMIVGGSLIYISLKLEHYSIKFVIRKIEFVHVIILNTSGILFIVDGILNFV